MVKLCNVNNRNSQINYVTHCGMEELGSSIKRESMHEEGMQTGYRLSFTDFFLYLLCFCICFIFQN